LSLPPPSARATATFLGRGRPEATGELSRRPVVVPLDSRRWYGNGRHTSADIDRAKPELRPDRAGALKDARWLVARLTEHIDRLSKMGDDQVASRIITAA
jgi:hypothetical protein